MNAPMVGIGWRLMAAREAGLLGWGEEVLPREEARNYPGSYPRSARFWALWDEMEALLKPRGRVLTYQTLVEKRACRGQLRLFRELFGESVEVTREACVSVYDRFKWDWAAVLLLSRGALGAYSSARYTHAPPATVPVDAWDKYRRASARAFADAYNSDTP